MSHNLKQILTIIISVEKAIDWAQKNIEKTFVILDKKVEKCKKIENESKKTFVFHVRLTPSFLWGKRYLVREKVSVLQSVRFISVRLIEDLL